MSFYLVKKVGLWDREIFWKVINFVDKCQSRRDN